MLYKNLGLRRREVQVTCAHSLGIARVVWNLITGVLAVVALIGSFVYLWRGNHAAWLDWAVLYLLLAAAEIRKK